MKAYAMTDTGKVRENNQDSVFCAPFPVGCLPNLFMVADGMGGHQAGDFASRFTIDHMVEQIRSADSTNPIVVINESIQNVNQQLVMQASMDEKLYGTGTTLVLATVLEDMLCVANIGDSRLYRINHGIRQITRDHSWVEEMYEKGKITRDSAIYSRQKNVITRAVGTQGNVTVDFFEVEIEPGDIYLLCSDGLTNMVSNEQIRKIIEQETDLEKTAERLISKANQYGGQDNISVVLIRPELDEVNS